jgi:hypothetical protein
MTLPSNWPYLLAFVLVLFATPLIDGVYDVIAYESGGDGATISVLTYTTAIKHPWFKWAVCEVIGVFIGHVFTTLPFPRVAGTWLPLVLFVILPFVAALVAAVLDFEPLSGVPLRESSRTHPLAVGLPVTVGWTVFGICVGSMLLHQT